MKASLNENLLDDSSEPKKEMPSYWSMLKQFLHIAVPMIFQCNFMLLTGMFNLIFAGRFEDSAKLAGVGLGNTTVNILLLSICMGMNGALETLVSQAFGYGNLQLCGVYLNRARLVGTLTYIPIAILLLFSETILVQIGQDLLTCHYAQRFISSSLIGFYFLCIFDM